VKFRAFPTQKSEFPKKTLLNTVKFSQNSIDTPNLNSALTLVDEIAYVFTEDTPPSPNALAGAV
jgi:hypothetical protein